MKGWMRRKVIRGYVEVNDDVENEIHRRSMDRKIKELCKCVTLSLKKIKCVLSQKCYNI